MQIVNIMKIVPTFIAVLLLLTNQSIGQPDSEQSPVVAQTSLNQLVEGRLVLKVYPPNATADTLIYAMPKIIPGTYSISDFGNLVYHFAALTTNGDTLAVERLDENRWQITDAKKLDHLGYQVGATFTDPAGKHIFEPAGTRFEKDRNFLLNNYGIVGYFEGYDDRSYQFQITRPESFYGASALLREELDDSTDVFSASNYFDLHDSPIMYAEPDTSSFSVGGSKVQMAVYSPGGSLDAGSVKENLDDIMHGAANYLGGDLPVDKYVILINLLEGMGNSGGFGALEHSYSTVVVMPEMGAAFLSKQIRDIVAHEFFHIVTPLNIHSEHIHNYNFNDPKMSQHLWLYEGATEYSAHHMQVRQGIITPDEFLSIVRQKIVQSGAFNDTLPFTTLSKGALDEYKNQYMNVYMKGALIGMCLDLLLCDLSEGSYNLPMLIADLSERYGADQPFKDDALFDVIAEMTYPEVRTFFARHVDGSEPLPLEEYLAKAGVTLQRNTTITELTFGGFLPGKNDERNKMEVVTTIGMNSFGRELGIEKGDLLVSVNKIDLSPEVFSEGIAKFKETFADGDKVTLVVERKNENGDWKTVKLKGRAQEVERSVTLRISYVPEPGEQQQKVRKAWINH